MKSTNKSNKTFENVIMDYSSMDSLSNYFWSTIIFAFNFFSLFSVIYWFSFNGISVGAGLYLDIIVEIVLFVEITVRIIILKLDPRWYSSISLFHVSSKDDTPRLLFLIWFACIPQNIIWNLLASK